MNPIDWYHYDGVHSDDPEDLLTFGYEVAGVIEAVGPGVTGFAVGDEVVVSEIPGNGYAEHVVVPASGLLAKPANVSFEVAASVPVAAGTAYHALEKTHVGRRGCRPGPRRFRRGRAPCWSSSPSSAGRG